MACLRVCVWEPGKLMQSFIGCLVSRAPLWSYLAVPQRGIPSPAPGITPPTPSPSPSLWS